MINHPDRAESRKVTIEELLRLKRAERPSPEFWTRFEQELRAKQLAAIVEKRPWWITLRLPQAARVLSRFQVPMGAAAALALGFIVVREYRPLLSPSVPVAPVVVVAAVESGEPVIADRAIAPEMIPSVVLADRSDATLVATSDANAMEPSPSAPLEAMPIGPGGLMAMIPWAVSQAAPVDRPSDQAAPLGELPQVHFAAAVNPGRDHDFHGRVEVDDIMTSHARTVSVAHDEVVAQVLPVSPREVRRSRILSSLVVADNSPDGERSRLAQVREVLATSLDEDRLYDSVRRLGMGGDRLTLKF